MESSRKYLCEFRGRCPQFDKTSHICLETPWTCRNWKMHKEAVKRGIKPITNARDFKLREIMGRPELREETLYEDSDIRMVREDWIREAEKNYPAESRTVSQEKENRNIRQPRK